MKLLSNSRKNFGNRNKSTMTLRIGFKYINKKEEKKYNRREKRLIQEQNEIIFLSVKTDSNVNSRICVG